MFVAVKIPGLTGKDPVSPCLNCTLLPVDKNLCVETCETLDKHLETIGEARRVEPTRPTPGFGPAAGYGIKKPKVATCQICGKEFVPNKFASHYYTCPDPACRQAWHLRYIRDLRRISVYLFTCPYCGKTVELTRKNRATCGAEKCQSKHRAKMDKAKKERKRNKRGGGKNGT